MDAHFLSPWIFSIFIVMIMGTFWTCRARDNDLFSECNSNTYSCGPNIRGIRYPFWGGGRPQYCGRRPFNLTCHHDTYSVLETDNHRFRVLDINQNRNTMTMARLDLWDDLCGQSLSNVTLNESLFDPTSTVRKLYIFYNCTDDYLRGMVGMNNFTCGEANGVYVDETFLMVGRQNLSSECDAGIEVPVQRTSLDGLQDGSLSLQEALNRGFDSAYNTEEAIRCSACVGSGGICGSDSNTDQFVCLCRDQPQPQLLICQNHDGGLNLGVSLVIGISAGVPAILALVTVICVKRKRILGFISSKKETINGQNVETFLKNYGALAPKRYSYSDIKRMTNSFRDKLGRGGYGAVYKGKLSDGRLVAVKLLSESQGNGEEFINEVASISRTSHVHVVSLLGFCYERDKRALVYEFMSNGSLDKFICYDGTLATNYLNLKAMCQIAVSVARGLEYLHRGCNTRIVHFDIKPHNILLDDDFCPKISDFGLAKLCQRKESIMSMLGARGTIGYIAPEVFCRNFGGVSHKSDVYSYGMMLLEMVGGRKENGGGEVNNSSEMYFPDRIYKLLENDEDLTVNNCNASEEEKGIAKKMTLVGLWCIQTNPADRPSIGTVVEMLEGGVESLQIPPKPFLSSPTRFTQEYSSASLS